MALGAEVARAAEVGRLVPVRGTRVYVEDTGPRDAPALFYLHGGPGTGGYGFSFYQRERLSPRLRLVVIDQRGVLRSDPILETEMVVLDQSAHFAHVEEPDRFARLVTSLATTGGLSGEDRAEGWSGVPSA